VDVISAITSRESALRDRLARVAGCVEVRVVVTRGRDREGTAVESGDAEVAMAGPVVLTDADGPGTAFLKRHKGTMISREVGCEEVRHAIRAAANSLIVDQHSCESARGRAFFAVLVRRASVDAFRSAVAEMLLFKAFGLSVLGPFAPYSFAGDA
jgi:predicted metallo-beta-lactamase superfamily hydrolase